MDRRRWCLFRERGMCTVCEELVDIMSKVLRQNHVSLTVQNRLWWLRNICINWLHEYIVRTGRLCSNIPIRHLDSSVLNLSVTGQKALFMRRLTYLNPLRDLGIGQYPVIQHQQDIKISGANLTRLNIVARESSGVRGA